MFSKKRQERRGSSSLASPVSLPTPTNAVPPPMVSPLQMTFDFDLDPLNALSVDPFRPSEDSIARPQTSDGLGITAAGSRKSTIGLQPPILPPIPRIASRHESVASSVSQPSEASAGLLGARHDSDNVSALTSGSRKSTGIRLMPNRSFEHLAEPLPASRSSEQPVELLPISGPLGAGLGLDERRSTSGESTTPRMQASIFPKVAAQSPVLPMVNTGPAMTREFIDSRDKPYSHPSARQPSISQPGARPQPVQSSQSMPFMSCMSSPNVALLQSPSSNHFSNQATSSDMPSIQSPNTQSLQASSPMLPSLQSPTSFSSFYSPTPASPYMPTPSSATSTSLRVPKISGARLSPNSSVEDLRLLQRSSTNGTAISKAPTVYSLSDAPYKETPSTAPSMHAQAGARSSASKAHSPSAHSTLATIGTPYQATSPSFALPQHVSVRPKTAGGMGNSTVAGVSVPTHHTSAQRPKSASSSAKTEKRKTRLLNPMALLSRRKSSQESEEFIAERSAAAQAYARQRSVAAVGVNRMPADFDPRIKGNKVHDFSAPRQPQRNFSYNDAELQSRDPHLQSAHRAPSVPFLQYDPHHEQPHSGHRKHTSDSSSARRSVHSPMFREMLTEEPDTAKRVSSLNAERLENKGFLQRVSHHSSNSAFSQESSVLPPFAWRSQVLDPTQASLVHDDESKRSSDPSSGRERDSNLSSVSEVSPITARSSTQQVELRHSPNQSLSPVSPILPDKTFRPISAVSELAPKQVAQGMPTSPERRGRTTSEATARPYSVVLAQPAVKSIPESPKLPVERVQSPYRNSADAPEAVLVLDRTSSLTPDTLKLPIPLPGRTSDLPTPELTPEIGTANPVHFAVKQPPPQGPAVVAKLVEKRASAVGHVRRTSGGGGLSRHRVSNASRFSFQFGEGAEEEQALEEKHRRVKGESAEFEGRGGGGEEGEEEEEEFDEGAMDDMDELEVEREQERVGGEDAAAGSKVLSLQGAREQLRADGESDDGSVYDEEEDEVPNMNDERRLRHLTWAEHPAMRAHSALASHSRNGSQATNNQHDDLIDQYMQQSDAPQPRERVTSNASALTLDPNVHNSGDSAFVQDAFASHNSVPGGVGGARPRSGFYMQPKAAGYSPNASPLAERPPVPHRDSGNSERNRVASGLSFASASAPAGEQGKHASKVYGQGLPDVRVEHQRDVSHSTSGGRLSEARTNSSGLGLSGFSDFNFSDGPDMTLSGSRPTSYETTAEMADVNRRTKDSETIPQTSAGWAELQKRGSSGTPLSNGRASSYFSSPDSNAQNAAYRGSIGKSLRQRNAAVDQHRQYAESDSEEDGGDGMYFDDGGFEQDIKDPRNLRHDSVDEDEFDNPAFLSRVNRLSPHMPGHQRDASGMGLGSLGGDGPYPSFAMGANPVKARARQSHMLLEDLPLVGPVDPKLIPQRNPSEDAKRLGLSNRVPPLPPQPGSQEALSQMQVKMQAYHASLAEALNKAAAEGRFARQPSISTARTLSVREGLVEDDVSRDDRSHYSRDENGADSLSVPSGKDGLNRSVSQDTSGSKMGQSNTYSPPKMSFDFGFEDQLTNDSIVDGLDANDDIVAAANAEALASDDEGFYGQEFGFYAKARPESGDMEAVNGGYFGEDGDGGLTRNKSWKEPNMTPISERTEFSTRNSFINLGHGAAFGPPSAGLYGPGSPALARLPVSPLAENEITSFDQLRKLRANAFGGSNGSLQSEHGPANVRAWQGAMQSPTVGARASGQGYFGAMGGSPMTLGYSTDSSGSSNPASAHPHTQSHSDHLSQRASHDSPQSAVSGALQFTGGDNEMTPRKAPQKIVAELATARKVPAHAANGHSRKGSDSVTYVREQDPVGGGQPRWVLERRRTSEQGQLELVGREVVQGGWI